MSRDMSPGIPAKSWNLWDFIYFTLNEIFSFLLSFDFYFNHCFKSIRLYDFFNFRNFRNLTTISLGNLQIENLPLTQFLKKFSKVPSPGICVPEHESHGISVPLPIPDPGQPLLRTDLPKFYNFKPKSQSAFSVYFLNFILKICRQNFTKSYQVSLTKYKSQVSAYYHK